MITKKRKESITHYMAMDLLPESQPGVGTYDALHKEASAPQQLPQRLPPSPIITLEVLEPKPPPGPSVPQSDGDWRVRYLTAKNAELEKLIAGVTQEIIRQDELKMLRLQKQLETLRKEKETFKRKNAGVTVAELTAVLELRDAAEAEAIATGKALTASRVWNNISLKSFKQKNTIYEILMKQIFAEISLLVKMQGRVEAESQRHKHSLELCVSQLEKYGVVTDRHKSVQEVQRLQAMLEAYKIEVDGFKRQTALETKLAAREGQRSHEALREVSTLKRDIENVKREIERRMAMLTPRPPPQPRKMVRVPHYAIPLLRMRAPLNEVVPLPPPVPPSPQSDDKGETLHDIVDESRAPTPTDPDELFQEQEEEETPPPLSLASVAREDLQVSEQKVRMLSPPAPPLAQEETPPSLSLASVARTAVFFSRPGPQELFQTEENKKAPPPKSPDRDELVYSSFEEEATAPQSPEVAEPENRTDTEEVLQTEEEEKKEETTPPKSQELVWNPENCTDPDEIFQVKSPVAAAPTVPPSLWTKIVLPATPPLAPGGGPVTICIDGLRHVPPNVAFTRGHMTVGTYSRYATASQVYDSPSMFPVFTDLLVHVEEEFITPATEVLIMWEGFDLRKTRKVMGHIVVRDLLSPRSVEVRLSYGPTTTTSSMLFPLTTALLRVFREDRGKKGSDKKIIYDTTQCEPSPDDVSLYLSSMARVPLKSSKLLLTAKQVHLLEAQGAHSRGQGVSSEWVETSYMGTYDEAYGFDVRVDGLSGLNGTHKVVVEVSGWQGHRFFDNNKPFRVADPGLRFSNYMIIVCHIFHCANVGTHPEKWDRVGYSCHQVFRPPVFVRNGSFALPIYDGPPPSQVISDMASAPVAKVFASWEARSTFPQKKVSNWLTGAVVCISVQDARLGGGTNMPLVPVPGDARPTLCAVLDEKEEKAIAEGFVVGLSRMGWKQAGFLSAEVS